MAEEFKSWLHNSTTKLVGLLFSMFIGILIWIFVQVFHQGLSHLKSIDNKFDALSKDIVEIKLSDSANSTRMNRLELDVLDIKSNEKELSKRVSELEKSSGQHDQQLRQLNK